MTSSNGNIFRITGHLCGEFTGPRWIPHTKTSDAEFDVVFDLRLNKRLSKQSWGWWFETLSRSLWRHRNVTPTPIYCLAWSQPMREDFNMCNVFCQWQRLCLATHTVYPKKFALLCCGYAIVHNEFTWSIYPFSSGLLCWHWGNR